MIGSDFGHRQLGIVGLGRIGSLGGGEGPCAWDADRLLHPQFAQSARVREHVVRPAAVHLGRRVLHVPLTPETRHLIDRTALSRMKRSAYLINTSRGPVVDEDALVWALREGVIKGAGLDVYEDEPQVHPGLMRARERRARAASGERHRPARAWRWPTSPCATPSMSSPASPRSPPYKWGQPHLFHRALRPARNEWGLTPFFNVCRGPHAKTVERRHAQAGRGHHRPRAAGC